MMQFLQAHRRAVCVLTCAATIYGLFVVYTSSPTYTEAQQIGETEIAKRRAELKAELANLEQLIARQQELLDDKQGERVTLERDLAIIAAEIEKSRLAIRARSLEIERLQDEIGTREQTIELLSQKLEREKESLSEIVRRTAEVDDMTLVELVLSNKSFSEFFEELDDFQAVKMALQTSFEEIEALQAQNKTVRDQLESQHAAQIELKTIQELEQNKIQSKEEEIAVILRKTKGEEATYQQLIAENQRSAAEIRSELFELQGTTAIPLGDAIQFATFAGARTGVRPALILGVLKQETRLGEFLGNGTWSQDMHPTRDRPLFKVIAATLGLDPNTMPVSAQPSYGWGGAMGPAQFIPSTWACYGGYVNVKTNDCSNSARSMDWDSFWAGPWKYDASKDRLRVVRGKSSPSNPWDNQDAFTATALLMKDNGADRGGYTAERLAALRYFAGWVNAENPSYAFYGDGVMEHASYYQKQIDTLQRLSEQ